MVGSIKAAMKTSIRLSAEEPHWPTGRVKTGSLTKTARPDDSFAPSGVQSVRRALTFNIGPMAPDDGGVDLVVDERSFTPHLVIPAYEPPVRKSPPVSPSSGLLRHSPQSSERML